MQLSELIKILQEDYPVAEDQKSLRYSDEYELLETEIQKLTSLHGGKPDHQIVIDNGIVLLKQGSTQPYVVTAIAYAMLEQYAWPGFLEGIRFVGSHLKGGDQFGQWLVERYQRYLDAHPINGLGKDFIAKILEALKTWNLDGVITLIRPFEDQKKRVKLEEDARERQTKLDEEKRQREAEAALNPTIIQENEEIFEAREDAYLDFIKQNPFEFSAYKYSRAEMWWRLPLSAQELLNIIDDHNLDWEGYSAALKLKATQKYEEALIAFETLAHAYPYFLELQWHICDCLEALNADEALLTMLKNECRELCSRYPELENAKIDNTYLICSKQAKAYFGIFQMLNS